MTENSGGGLLQAAETRGSEGKSFHQSPSSCRHCILSRGWSVYAAQETGVSEKGSLKGVKQA
jgi:hypothetical protein